MQEYSRACLIAFESLPKHADREGWGRPGGSPCFVYWAQLRSGIMGVLDSTPHAFSLTGTRWDGVCFRRSLLDTVPNLGPSLKQHIPVPVLSFLTQFFLGGGRFFVAVVLFFWDILSFPSRRPGSAFDSKPSGTPT